MPLSRGHRRDPVVCAAEDLSVELGGLPVLRGITLTVAGRRGGRAAGRQRSGKSTLVRALLGLVPGPARLGRAVRSRRCGRSAHWSPDRLRPAALHRRPRRGQGRRGGRLRPAGPAPAVRSRPSRATGPRCATPWRRSGWAAAPATDCRVLSGGQQQRVLIARALAGAAGAAGARRADRRGRSRAPVGAGRRH